MVRHPYQRAVRLCVLASDRWSEIDAAYYQINLMRQPPWRIVSLVNAWALPRIEHGKLSEWEAELLELLPWQDTDSQAAIDLESESFFNMQARG